MSTVTLPDHIDAYRIGYYPETDYDEFGELAPITWVCRCGSSRKLEYFDHEIEEYVPVRQERKDAWLAMHARCGVLRRIDPRFCDTLALAVEAAGFACYSEQGGFEGGVWDDALGGHAASDWRECVTSIDLTWHAYDLGDDNRWGTFADASDHEIEEADKPVVTYSRTPSRRLISELPWWNVERPTA